MPKRYHNKVWKDGDVGNLKRQGIYTRAPIKNKDHGTEFYTTTAPDDANAQGTYTSGTECDQYCIKPLIGITTGALNGQRTGRRIQLRSLHLDLQVFLHNFDPTLKRRTQLGVGRIIIFTDKQTNGVDLNGTTPLSLFTNTGLLQLNDASIGPVNALRALDTRQRFSVIYEKQYREEPANDWRTPDDLDGQVHPALAFKATLDIPLNEKVTYEDASTTGNYQTDILSNALYVYILLDKKATDGIQHTLRYVSRVTYQDAT